MKALSAVILILGLCAVDLISDIVIRHNPAPGTNPDNWDQVTSLGMGSAFVVWVILVLFKDDEK